MQIKMNEYYQGSGVSAVLLRTGDTVNILTPGESYEVDLTLGSWLIDNRKAVQVDAKEIHVRFTEIISEVNYGAQAEPELRHDEEVYKELTEEPQAEDEPLMSTENTEFVPKKKRSKK